MSESTRLHTRVSSLNVVHDGEDMLNVNVSTASSYRIEIRNNYNAHAFLGMVRQIMQETSSRRIILLSDDYIGPKIGLRLARDLEKSGHSVDHFFMPAGEHSKSTDMLMELWTWLKGKGVERRSLIIGVGGGVVCDIAGLTAATYLRGLPYMLVPTSLMAQVDAAIGGKVGADFRSTKNWIGGFYHPVAVVMFAEHLDSLDDEEFSNGMAELIKVAAIVGGSLWTESKGISSKSLRDNPSKLTGLIRAGFAAKLTLLSPDPYEVSSLDRELNFGHCLGHAVEAASNFNLRHGYAVAIGMMMATRVGRTRGISSQEMLDQLEERIAAYGLPVELEPQLVEQSWQSVEDLRKVRNGALRMPVPVDPGKMVFINDITYDEFRKASIK